MKAAVVFFLSSIYFLTATPAELYDPSQLYVIPVTVSICSIVFTDILLRTVRHLDCFAACFVNSTITLLAQAEFATGY